MTGKPELTEYPVPQISQGKIGRNDPCPCGGGKKYKKCHGKTPSVNRNLCAVTGVWTKHLWKGTPLHPAIINLAKHRMKNMEKKSTLRLQLLVLKDMFEVFAKKKEEEDGSLPTTHAGWAVIVNEFIKKEWK